MSLPDLEKAAEFSKSYVIDVDGRKAVVIHETDDVTPLLIAATEPAYVIINGGGGFVHAALDSCLLIAELGAHVDIVNASSAGMLYALLAVPRVIHHRAGLLMHGFTQSMAPPATLARVLDFLSDPSFVPEARAIYDEYMRKVYSAPEPAHNWVPVDPGVLAATGASLGGRRERLGVTTMIASHDPRIILRGSP